MATPVAGRQKMQFRLKEAAPSFLRPALAGEAGRFCFCSAGFRGVASSRRVGRSRGCGPRLFPFGPRRCPHGLPQGTRPLMNFASCSRSSAFVGRVLSL